MNIKIKFISIIFYLTSLLLLSIYVTIELTPNIFLVPRVRLLLLTLTCLSLYLGSLLMGITLEKNKKDTLMRTTNWIFFAVYIILLSTLVLFDQMFGRQISSIFLLSGRELQLHLTHTVNIVPFKEIWRYVAGFINNSMNLNIIITNLLGNLVAFTPFALFLPMLTRINTFKRFFITILLITLGVEILQLVTMSGSCDIDDVILNVGGALIMYMILQIPCIKRFIKILLGDF